jgi:hypothetical protein
MEAESDLANRIQLAWWPLKDPLGIDHWKKHENRRSPIEEDSHLSLERTFPVHVARMEPDLYCFPNCVCSIITDLLQIRVSIFSRY